MNTRQVLARVIGPTASAVVLASCQMGTDSLPAGPSLAIGDSPLSSAITVCKSGPAGSTATFRVEHTGTGTLTSGTLVTLAAGDNTCGSTFTAWESGAAGDPDDSVKITEVSASPGVQLDLIAAFGGLDGDQAIYAPQSWVVIRANTTTNGIMVKFKNTGTPSGCPALNPFFGLGPAGAFTVLGLAGANPIISAGETRIEGDVGVGPGNSGSLLKATIDGTLRLDPTAHPDIHPDLVVTGGTVTQDLSSPATAGAAAAATLGALAPTQSVGNILGSRTIVGNGGVNVVSIGSLKIVKGVLTIQGGPSDVFVFNVSGDFIFGSSQMVLSGGVLPTNILWNILGPGSDVAIYKDITVEYGTFLVPQRNIVIDHSVLTGSVIGGMKISIHSGATAKCK